MHELDRKRFRKRPRGAVGEHDRGRFRSAPADAQQSIRDPIGLVSRDPALRDLLREPSQIFDQHDLQRDRSRPKFADHQRLDRLIGVDEADEDVGVKTAVGVGDKRPSHAEHARVAGERARGQFRQLAIVAGRQIHADLTDLPFDQMVIVDKPLRRRRRRAPFVGRLHDLSIGRQQDRAVVGQSGGERQASGRPQSDGLRDRETARMRLQAFDAEQFLADRRFAVPGRRSSLKAGGSEATGMRIWRSNPCSTIWASLRDFLAPSDTRRTARDRGAANAC